MFNKLDKNGDGSVSLDEVSSALKGAGGKGHHPHVASSGGSSGSATSADGETDALLQALQGASSTSNTNSGTTAGGATDPLLQALQGASSTSTTNSDGTTTTLMTYADGSKVSMTSAPASTSSSTATSFYNVIEQMIQRQAQAVSTSAASSLSVSV